MRLPIQAVGLMVLMILAPLSGCFGENEVETLDAGSLSVSNSDALQAGMWQTITLQASNDLAVFVPYFIQDPGSCLLYTSPSPRDRTRSRMPSSA